MEHGSGEMSDLDAALPYRDSLDGLSPPPGGSPALFLGDGAAALPSVVSRPPLPGVAARPGAAAYGAPQPSSAAPHPGAASSAAALPGEAAGSRSSAASRLQMNQSEVSGLLRLGMHETDGGEESYAAECSNMNQDTFHEATKFDVAMTTLAVFNDHGNTSACLDEYHMPGIQPSEEIRFGSRQHCERQSEGMVADSEEESIPSSPDTSSTTNYDMPGYTEHNLQHIYNAYEAIVCPLVDKEGPVVLSPDFIMCDKTVHLEPHLTFSSDGIQIEYLEDDSCEDNKMIALHWEISNIISISCKWVHSVGHAFITLLAGSEAEIGNSGPVSVQFCLDDLQWPRKQHNIWHLGARYQEIWKDIASDDFDSESIEPNLFFPRQYFSSTVDFEDVIYPKGDPDAVSISKRDAELLLPETFVNDTIIDFYIKYLSTRIESIEKCRYHFFNSFFFRKLADLDKDQGRAPDGRAAFLRVRKWTRKINIFEKDFLFIPVNFNLHWSLIVICYPGEVATFEDGQKKLSAKLPCILHMDSLKGSHIGLKDIIQSYLFEEWKERHPESASDNSDKFLNLRFVSLELPQQDNSFDCGLFLLHYVELFLMDAPSDFNPLKIDVFSDFLSDDWFPPAEASLKRSVIQKLINELVTGSFQNYPELACSNEKLDESYHGNRNAKLELAGEFLAQRCSAGEPESVCTTHDGTHGTESSTSICLNDSEGKGLHASGWMLGKVSMVAEQNLQEPRVCTPDENTVCLSSQDEKNEPLLTESNNHLNMRSCAPEDAEMLKGSSCVVTDKEHKESLLVSLDDNQKVSSQAEVEVQDTMVSRCCSISENAEEVIACQEHSLQRNTDEAGDECYKPSQDVDSFMMLDTSKDDLGSNLAGTTGEGDGSDICEDMDSVRLGDMNKDIADTKHKDGLADPLTVENATNDSAKEISTTEDNINPSEKYVSSELTEGTTNNGLAGDISKLKVGSADNGTTGDSAVSCDLNQGNTYQVMGGDCTNQTDGEDANQYLVADGAVPCEDDTTCSDAEMSLVDGPCREKNETVPENTISDVKSPQPDGICEEKDIVVSGDKCVQKDDAPGTDAKRPLPDGICEENDIVVSGDKSIQKDITHGTDMKIERHYKRRKVLAAELERQRSSSSLD